MNFNMLAGLGLFALGQGLIWFQINSQFVWDWWKYKPLAAVCLYAIPAVICWWYGTKLIVGETESLWSARFIGFASSYLVFPLLTWWLAHESMFTWKTMMCTGLAMVIMAIQFFWR